MTRASRIAPTLLLLGCGGPIGGRWVGECDLLYRDRVQGLDVSLYISKARGGAIEGSADIVGHDASYTLEGTEDESAVAFTLHGTVEDDGDGVDPEWWLDFSGTLDEDADPPLLSGDATYWTELYEGGVSTGVSDPWDGTCSFEGID